MKIVYLKLQALGIILFNLPTQELGPRNPEDSRKFCPHHNPKRVASLPTWYQMNRGFKKAGTSTVPTSELGWALACLKMASNFMDSSGSGRCKPRIGSRFQVIEISRIVKAKFLCQPNDISWSWCTRLLSHDTGCEGCPCRLCLLLHCFWGGFPCLSSCTVPCFYVLEYVQGCGGRVWWLTL